VARFDRALSLMDNDAERRHLTDTRRASAAAAG
jgi:hypothetical protein